MKKTYWLLFSLLVVGLLLGACNGEDEAQGAEGAEGDVVEIDFFHRWPNEPRKSFYDEKIKQFEAANPGVKINVDQVLNDSYKEKIRVLVSNDELPDIFTSWSDSFAENLVSSGRIKELNDILSDDTAWSGEVLESQFGGFTFDDVTYGVPFTVDGKAFFYNKEIFEQNNLEVPQTYEQFITALDELQAAGYKTPLVEGLTNTWAISHYLGTIFQRVVDPAVLEKDYAAETGEFTDKGYVRGLEIWKELTSYMGDVSTAIDHEAARNMFAAGEIPVLYMQFAEVKMVQDASDFEFGFFNFPEVEGGKGDQKALTGAPEGWMLSKNAPPEAVEFLKFLTSAETAKEFTTVDGQLNAINGGVTEKTSNPTSLEAYDIILNASATAPWFDNAVDINVADVFMRGGQDIATGVKTPEDVLQEAQEAAKKLH